MTSVVATTPLRFGILGAARIAPEALLNPAKTHAEVNIAAVACRDQKRGAQFARKYNIPKTFTGPKAYQDLIADPDIDAVYNPLPNSLHFEWSMRALLAGKHVLVEKPMTNTAEEARQLFAVAEEKGLVILEAMHSTFHPAMRRVRELVASGEFGKVKSVQASLVVPYWVSRFLFLKDDVRFKYELGGGATLDMGVYPLAAIRCVTGADISAPAVTSATSIGHLYDPARIDRRMHATYALPDSVTAESTVDSGTPGWGPFGLLPSAIHINLVVSLEGGEISLLNFVAPSLYHSIKVKPKRGTARTEKAYTYADGRGNKSWSTYRYQLEAFVDKVQGRTPWEWIEPETTITSMDTLERVYAVAGLLPRVASSYRPETALSTATTASGDAA